MPINKLVLKNFKCFKEVEVDFSKITLLTGENSSGKSSLISGLLAPLQSNGFPLYLFPNGKYINMGDFQEISFKNIKNNKIEINFDFDYFDNNFFYCDDTRISTKWILDSINQLPKLYQLELINDKYVIEISLVEDYYQCNIYERSYEEEKNILNLKTDNLSSLLDKKNQENSNFGGYLEFWQVMVSELEDNFNLISSYRLNPERTYYQKPRVTYQVLPSGEGFIDQILEWKEKDQKRFDYLINILKDLKLLYDIKTQKIGGGRFDLRVKVKRTSNWASLADIGFGVSQLLPIIVADLQLQEIQENLQDEGHWIYSTPILVMAQPETHLHPSIQAELATYLVKQVNQFRKQHKQYIVETHSEYLINRLRLSIVKGEIEPEDVAVYYFENTVKEGSIAHRIEFTKQGQILNAPQGFFDTYMMDTMNIALNA